MLTAVQQGFKGKQLQGAFDLKYRTFTATQMGASTGVREFTYSSLRRMQGVLQEVMEQSVMINPVLLDLVVEMDTVMSMMRNERHGKLPKKAITLSLAQ